MIQTHIKNGVITRAIPCFSSNLIMSMDECLTIKGDKIYIDGEVHTIGSSFNIRGEQISIGDKNTVSIRGAQISIGDKNSVIEIPGLRLPEYKLTYGRVTIHLVPNITSRPTWNTDLEIKKVKNIMNTDITIRINNNEYSLTANQEINISETCNDLTLSSTQECDIVLTLVYA